MTKKQMINNIIAIVWFFCWIDNAATIDISVMGHILSRHIEVTESCGPMYKPAGKINDSLN
jgi:hypothetical protein